MLTHAHPGTRMLAATPRVGIGSPAIIMDNLHAVRNIRLN
jgi:hypothetical protein